MKGLSQLFFHMPTLKALTKLSVTNHYDNDLNVSMNQYHLSTALWLSAQQCWFSLRMTAHYME